MITIIEPMIIRYLLEMMLKYALSLAMESLSLVSNEYCIVNLICHSPKFNVFRSKKDIIYQGTSFF